MQTVLSRAGFTIDTDISLLGENERHWLDCGPDQILIRKGKNQEVVFVLGTDEIETARTIACVGCGILQVKMEGEWRELLGFSNALSERFHLVARRIERLYGRADSAEEDGDSCDTGPNDDEGDLDPPTCPSCRFDVEAAGSRMSPSRRAGPRAAPATSGSGAN